MGANADYRQLEQHINFAVEFVSRYYRSERRECSAVAVGRVSSYRHIKHKKYIKQINIIYI